MKDIRRLARKAMAALLALIMFSAHVPGIVTEMLELRANPVNMQISLSGALVAGGEIGPRFDENGAVEGQATLSWGIPQINQLDRLVFPLRRWVPPVNIPPAPPSVGQYVNDIVVMHLLRVGDNEMWVEYQVFEESDAAMLGGFGGERVELYDNFLINFGSLGPTNDYRYFRHDHSYWINHMNAIEPTATPPEIFNPNRIASTMRGLVSTDPRPFGGPRHLLDPPNPVDMGPAQQPPFFRVQRGGGFSFALQAGTVVDQSEAHAVHFVWDNEFDLSGNTFIMTTGGLRPGAFYEFGLSRSNTIDWMDPAMGVVWPSPPPPASPTNRFSLVNLPVIPIAVRRAFTGFLMSTVPLAHHRELPQDPSGFTLGRRLYDFLFYEQPSNYNPAPAPTPMPPWPWTPREPWLHGYTNWDINPHAQRVDPFVLDPLWNPWNMLDHTHPVHTGYNDHLPGFAGTRPDAVPQNTEATNMVRLTIEVPFEFVSRYLDPFNPPAGVHQEWERVDPTNFVNMNFDFEIDLLVPPNQPNAFRILDPFGVAGRSPDDNGNFPFIATDRTQSRGVFDGLDRVATDIYIMGLEPSRLFPDFQMRLTGSSLNELRPGMADVIVGDTAGGGGIFPVENVHTFLEFDVVFIGGRFHVRIFPYQEAHGTYVVITSNNISAPYLSGNRNVIYIPLDPAVESEIQVRFTPTMPPMTPVYSQVMVFRPVSDRHIFTEPANFVLFPDNPPLTFLEPSNLDEGVFSVDVGWDLATVAQLRDYFIEVNPGRGLGPGNINTFGPDSPNWQPGGTPGSVPPGWTYPGSLPLGARLVDPANPAHEEWYLPEDELIFTYRLHSRINPFDVTGTPFLDVHVTISRVDDPVHGWQFEWDYKFEDIITPPPLQVRADPPVTTAVPVPTSIFISKMPPAQYTAQVVDQFGRFYSAMAPEITWDISNVSGGTATIDASTGVVTASDTSVSYTVMVEAYFDTYGILLRRSIVVDNPTSMPTDLTLALVDRVYQGHSITFNTTLLPGTALNSLLWQVMDANNPTQPVPGATISQNGQLFVSRDVPAETELRVTATAQSMGSAPFTATMDVRVVVPERRMAISSVTENQTMRIGVGPGGTPGGGIRLDMVASRMGVTVPPLPHFFNFPEIYHITSQLIDINANHNRDEQITPPLPESNAQPMTLDAPADLTFPPPQNLQAWVDPDDDDDYYGGFFDMSFDVPLGRMRHYVTNSPRYETTADGANVRTFVRVFIAENQGQIAAITGMLGEDRVGTGTSQATRIIVPASVNGSHQTLMPFSASDNLEALRSGPVVFEMEIPPAVFFTDTVSLEQTLKLHGLDRNRQYFVTLDAFAEWETMPAHITYSTTTNIAGVTTYGDLVPPDPGGMRPSAPQDLRVDDFSVSSADLSWLPVEPLTPEGPPEGGEIRYQILRMRADQLPDELLDSHNMHMTDVLAEISDLGLVAPEAVLMTRGNTLGYNEVLNYATGAVAPGFTLSHGTLPDEDERRVIFHDGNLQPNSLYFYYVRTVWETSGPNRTYSSWVGVSVTTSLVEPPENLRIELAPWIGGTLWQDFDPRFQFVIRFDAPIQNLEHHGTYYDFQYSLMEGNALWNPPERLITAMQLERIPTPGREGFYQFTYLISGLLPGTQYSIRVRTMDLVNGDYSMYSNIATTRTDTDQDAVNRERDRENLHQYLRDLIAEFIRQHYWTAQNSHNVLSAVYRPSMVNNLVETNGSMIRLAMTGQDINVYYLPHALFERTWRAERGFIIAKDDMEIAIPSHAFNMIDNEAILQALQRIRDVPAVRDYYVRITVAFNEHANNIEIHGRPPAGSEIVMNFEVVEASTTAAQLDDDILTVLQHRLNTDYYTLPFMEEIEQMLDREESFEDMVRRLHQIADVIMNQMAAYVNSQLLPTLDRVYEVNYVSRPITIRLINQPRSAVVNGFRFAGTNWVQTEVNIQGTARAMRTNGTGAFAFNILNLNLPGVSQMQGNETLTALFVRYGLHDFLGLDDSFNLQNNITLQQVQGISARLAGAPSAANPQTWLRGQGYIVPVRGASSPATTQEAIYTLMAVYEIRTNTNINSLRISNFNAASGINGIDARFRPSIQAAFELNLYSNANMNPTAPITVEDVLRMILAINQRVPL